MNKRKPCDHVIVDHDRSEGKWHLDKRVPLALIATLFFQTVTAIWWASGITSDVKTLQAERAQEAKANIPDRLTRVEVILEQIPNTLSEIKVLIRDLQDKGKK